MRRHDRQETRPLISCGTISRGGSSLPLSQLGHTRKSPMTYQQRFAHFGTNAVHAGQEPEQWSMNQVKNDEL